MRYAWDHTAFMPFSAAAVANEFLRLAYADRRPVTPLKMQKLVYFAHGWYLAVTGRPLISESVQAWKYGPVIPTLYKEFKEYGDEPIPFPAMTFVPGKGKSVVSLDDEGTTDEVALARQVIQRVWAEYGSLTAEQLSSITHDEGSPWDSTPHKDVAGTEISDDKIKEYFLRQAVAS